MIKAATTEEESNGGGTACGGDELAGEGGTTSPVLVSEPLRPIIEVTDYPICRPNPRKPRSRISSPISLLSLFLLTSPRRRLALSPEKKTTEIMTGRKRQEKTGNREDDEEQTERMQRPRPKNTTPGTKKTPKNVKGKGIVGTAEQPEYNSEDDFMDRPITSIIRRIIKEGKESRKEVRSKSVHDRPHKKPKQDKVEVPTDTTSKKRKAPDNIGDETVGSHSKFSKDCRRSKKKKDFKTSMFPKVLTRTSPHTLVNSFQLLNISQRQAVAELGFDQILRLSITEVPSRLAYWVIDNFNACSCELVLDKGRSIQVNPVDIRRVYGFPMGNISIDIEEKNGKKYLVDEYLSAFGGRTKIGQKEILDKMLMDKEGGVWFKRHFIVLLVSSLIENSSNGYANLTIMQNLEDLEKVKHMDWCTYTLKSLAMNKRAWENSKHKAFLGSTLFLTVFYADRVSVFEATCKRDYPIVINWTDQLLRDRQKNELRDGRLGQGRPVDPIDIPEFVEKAPSPQHAEECIANASEFEDYASKLYNQAKKIGEQMVELLTMIENQPTGIVMNENLEKAIRTSQMLCTGGGSERTSTDCTQFDSTQADRFWGKSDILKCIAEIEDAHKREGEFVQRTDDMPSFSLGLTQILEDVNEDATEPRNDQPKDNPKSNVASLTDNPQKKQNTKKDDGSTDLKGKKKVLAEKKSDVAEEEITREAPQPHTRNLRSKKKTEKFCSPNIERKMSTAERLTKTEREISHYVLLSDEDRMEQVIFKCGDCELRRSELLSLRTNLFVHAEVVTSWSIILNFGERKRSKESPLRFFASVSSTINSVTIPFTTWSTEKREKYFMDNITHELELIGISDVKTIDMFFFPMYKDSHFYLVCFDVKQSTMFVIDNANTSEMCCISLQKYHGAPQRLKKLFAAYLQGRGYTELSKKVGGMAHDTLHISWVHEDNDKDCAIYVMRHMETFMGKTGREWKHGIVPSSTDQLKYMRARYCAAIATSEFNELRQTVIDAATKYCSDLTKKQKGED